MEPSIVRALLRITTQWQPMTIDGVLVEVREAFGILALFEDASTPERQAYLHGCSIQALVAEVHRRHEERPARREVVA